MRLSRRYSGRIVWFRSGDSVHFFPPTPLTKRDRLHQVRYVYIWMQLVYKLYLVDINVIKWDRQGQSTGGCTVFDPWPRQLYPLRTRNITYTLTLSTSKERRSKVVTRKSRRLNVNSTLIEDLNAPAAPPCATYPTVRLELIPSVWESRSVDRSYSKFPFLISPPSLSF